MGAEQALNWEHHEDPLPLVRSLRAAGHQIAVVETAGRAVDIYDWWPTFPVCVIFGNEVDGVSPALAELADAHVRIPTLGSKQSLAVAGGVVMYELLRKYRRLLEREGK